MCSEIFKMHNNFTFACFSIKDWYWAAPHALYVVPFEATACSRLRTLCATFHYFSLGGDSIGSTSSTLFLSLDNKCCLVRDGAWEAYRVATTSTTISGLINVWLLGDITLSPSTVMFVSVQHLNPRRPPYFFFLLFDDDVSFFSCDFLFRTTLQIVLSHFYYCIIWQKINTVAQY